MLGIFDSGVGGLTVIKEIKKRKPDLALVYLGDTARVPWGSKSEETVRIYADQIVNFLVKKGCDKIVIACNTASVFTGDYLKNKFPDIKFIDVIDPVISKISEVIGKDSGARIGIIGTKATINSGVYKEKINKLNSNIKIISQACPLFVPLVEEGIETPKLIHELIQEYLKKIKGKIDYLVLGCTHYPLLEKSIKKYLGKEVKIISSAKEVAKVIATKNQKRGHVEYYYLTDLSEHYKELARRILSKKIKIRKVNL